MCARGRPDFEWALSTRALHGRVVAYRIAGRGPLLVLVHGIASSSRTWEAVADRLAGRFTLLAPDLPGHGGSDPAPDSSPAAAAATVRDLMLVLGHHRATFVGHSLGGGVVMQAAYHFPELVDRLVLVASGGLGTDVTPLLRWLALPGAAYVMPLGFPRRALDLVAGLSRRVEAMGVDSPELRELWACYRGLSEARARRAFIDTLRTVVGLQGQRLTATDRLYLAALVPTLIVWGDRDRIIPASHAAESARAMPTSRLEILPGVGHFPHAERPERFAASITEFVEGTAPARLRRADLRRLLAGGTAALPASPRRVRVASGGRARADAGAARSQRARRGLTSKT